MLKYNVQIITSGKFKQGGYAMGKKQKKREFSGAALAPTKSVAQFVIEQLLAGLMVQVMIDGKICNGHICQLDFGKGSDYVFAQVCVQDPADEEEPIYVKVSIHTDGTVNVMPIQPED